MLSLTRLTNKLLALMVGLSAITFGHGGCSNDILVTIDPGGYFYDGGYDDEYYYEDDYYYDDYYDDGLGFDFWY